MPCPRVGGHSSGLGSLLHPCWLAGCVQGKVREGEAKLDAAGQAQQQLQAQLEDSRRQLEVARSQIQQLQQQLQKEQDEKVCLRVCVWEPLFCVASLQGHFAAAGCGRAQRVCLYLA